MEPSFLRVGVAAYRAREWEDVVGSVHTLSIHISSLNILSQVKRVPVYPQSAGNESGVLA